AEADAQQGAGAHQREIDHVLQEAGALTDASFSYRATLERLARLSLPLLADWVTIYELPGEGGTGRRVALAAEGRAAEEALEHALRNAPLRMNDPHPLAVVDEVLRTGQPRNVALRAQRLDAAGRDPGERLLLNRLEPAHLYVAPLHARGRLLGA